MNMCIYMYVYIWEYVYKYYNAMVVEASGSLQNHTPSLRVRTRNNRSNALSVCSVNYHRFLIYFQTKCASDVKCLVLTSSL